MGRRLSSLCTNMMIALVVSSCGAVVGELAGRMPTTYNVVRYGAVGNGRTDDSKAFLAAWKAACSDAGSPTLVVPGGRTFMVGPLRLWGKCKSPVHVQVDGNVVRPNENWGKEASWIQFLGIDGLTIDGHGQFDGTGQFYWRCKAKRTCNVGPNTLVLLGIKKLELGGLRFMNSSQFHVVVGWCHTASLHHLTISAPRHSPNTDGIHVAGTNDVRIAHSLIATGDDCIAIGNGSVNVLVHNVTCGPGHGISIGSLGARNTQGIVEKISITNSFIFDTDNGLRIKTWQGGSGYVRDILYENIKLENVRRPILIDQFYCPFKVCPTKPSAVKISNVKYMNVRGTTVSDVAVTLNCSSSVPCKRIHMDTINIRPASTSRGRGRVAATSSAVCNNAYGTKKGIVTPHIPCLISQ